MHEGAHLGIINIIDFGYFTLIEEMITMFMQRSKVNYAKPCFGSLSKFIWPVPQNCPVEVYYMISMVRLGYCTKLIEYSMGRMLSACLLYLYVHHDGA